MTKWITVWELARKNLFEFYAIDLSQLNFRQFDMALLAGTVVAAAFALKALLYFIRVKERFKEQSGFFIRRRHRRGIIVRVLNFMPKAVMALGVCFFLFGLAGPFLSVSVETDEEIESQIRMELVDASTSMSQRFPGSPDKSKAQIVREFHLKFLEMRRDKNDLATFWMFASTPYRDVDYTFDFNDYFLHVQNAPFMFYSGRLSENAPRYGFVPRDRIAFITGEGGTNLQRALDAIIKQYDTDSRIQEIAVKDVQKALLITTDAEVHALPEVELRQLMQRDIIPIILFVDDLGSGECVDDDGSPIACESPLLIKRIQDFGGMYFDVSDESNLQAAYEAIDSMEKVGFKTKVAASELDVYQRFIALGLLVLMLGLVFDIFMSPITGVYP